LKLTERKMLKLGLQEKHDTLDKTNTYVVGHRNGD